MTFFEQEFRKLFADGSIIQSPQFLGQACFGELDRDLRVRVQFTDPSVLRSLMCSPSVSSIAQEAWWTGLNLKSWILYQFYPSYVKVRVNEIKISI